jgi:hypothetical protein
LRQFGRRQRKIRQFADEFSRSAEPATVTKTPELETPPRELRIFRRLPTRSAAIETLAREKK